MQTNQIDPATTAMIVADMPENLHGYHVHIYFDDTNKVGATDCATPWSSGSRRSPSGPKFVGIPGRIRSRSCRRSFRKPRSRRMSCLADVQPSGFDILIHPLTDDEVEDHTTHAVWIGKPVDLLIDKLNRAPTIQELMPS